VSVAPLLALSLVLEPGAAQGYAQAGWPVWLATVFAVVGVSLFGHGSFYTLVKRHEISLLAPLTLMTPIFGVLLGIGLLGEPASPKLLLGGALALSGVLIIALRPNARLPDASIRDKLPSPPT
jgi:O-acetylserine/cysteine efflux transporter